MCQNARKNAAPPPHVAREVSTLTLLNGKDVHLFLAPDDDRISLSDTADYLKGPGRKSFACANCGKRTRLLGNRNVEEYFLAELFASKLCFDCHFWLCKANNDRYLIINGRSYSFHCPEAYQANRQLSLAQRASCFLAQDLKTGKKILERRQVWQQGKVSDACRPYLPDTHRWLCPTCLKPIHEGAESFGDVCDCCRLAALSGARRLFPAKAVPSLSAAVFA